MWIILVYRLFYGLENLSSVQGSVVDLGPVGSGSFYRVGSGASLFLTVGSGASLFLTVGSGSY